MIAEYILSTESNKQQTNRANVQVSEQETETTTLPVDSSIILKRNLFGTSTEANKPPPVKEVPPAKPTQMDAVLMGTILTGEDNYQAVIMTKKDKKQQLVSVGEKVGEYRIVRIERGNVVLDDNGKEFGLDMMEANKYTPRAPAVSPAARQAKQQSEVRRVPKKPTRRIVVRPNNQEINVQGTEDVEPENNQEITDDEAAENDV